MSNDATGALRKPSPKVFEYANAVITPTVLTEITHHIFDSVEPIEIETDKFTYSAVPQLLENKEDSAPTFITVRARSGMIFSRPSLKIRQNRIILEFPDFDEKTQKKWRAVRAELSENRKIDFLPIEFTKYKSFLGYFIAIPLWISAVVLILFTTNAIERLFSENWMSRTLDFLLLIGPLCFLMIQILTVYVQSKISSRSVEIALDVTPKLSFWKRKKDDLIIALGGVVIGYVLAKLF